MFKALKKNLLKREKRAVAPALERALQIKERKISIGKAKIEHQMKRLSSERDVLRNKAERLRDMGYLDQAGLAIYQMNAKANTITRLDKHIGKLTAYETKIKGMRSDVSANREMSAALGDEEIIDQHTAYLIQRYAKLNEIEDESPSLDIEFYEKQLDTPIYSPLDNDEDFNSTRYSLDSIVGATPEMQSYIDSFRSNLVPLKRD